MPSCCGKPAIEIATPAQLPTAVRAEYIGAESAQVIGAATRYDYGTMSPGQVRDVWSVDAFAAPDQWLVIPTGGLDDN